MAERTGLEGAQNLNMSGFGSEPYGASAVQNVRIDVYLPAFRVSGQTATRFTRVADILNQLSSTHMVVEQATVSEYADPTATLGAHQVLVTVEQVLFVVAPDADIAVRPEMRIPKRAVRAQLGLPPFRVTGLVHVPQGSRPVDGLLNAADRFLAMTDVTVTSGAYPELQRHVDAVAVQRARAQVLLVSDDERPDQLLADVLDQQTAESWLPKLSDKSAEG
jgi:hypothetical protein